MEQKVALKILEDNIKNFDILAEEFSASRSRIWLDFKKFKNFVHSGNKILDIGCGNGRLYQLFQEKKVHYFGIDSSQKMIDLAKKQWSAKDNKPLFLKGNILSLPFANNSFDIVFCLAVLHHIPWHQLREKAIKECWRVLKPQGLFIVSVWNLFQPRLLLKYHNLLMLFGKHPQELDFGDSFIPWKTKNKESIKRYYHAFSKREIQKLLKHNFDIKDCYWSKKGQKTNFVQGNNLIIISKKRGLSPNIDR